MEPGRSCMSGPGESPMSRAGAVLLAAGLAVGHLSVVYFHIVLFAQVKYAGWPPVVPWLFLGAYAVSMTGIAIAGVARRDAVGAIVAAGTGTLAVEPFVSAFVVGAGCEVAPGSAGLPSAALDGVGLVVGTPGGACTTAVALPALLVAPPLVAVGVRAGALSAPVARWRAAAR